MEQAYDLGSSEASKNLPNSFAFKVPKYTKTIPPFVYLVPRDYWYISTCIEYIPYSIPSHFLRWKCEKRAEITLSPSVHPLAVGKQSWGRRSNTTTPTRPLCSEHGCGKRLPAPLVRRWNKMRPKEIWLNCPRGKGGKWRFRTLTSLRVCRKLRMFLVTWKKWCIAV